MRSSTSGAQRTVENRLGERHDGGAKADQDGLGAAATRDCPPAACAAAAVDGLGEEGPGVGEVHERLDGVEGALGGGEAALGVKGLPAVDVVDLAVELVGRPERPVQPAVLHGVRAAEHVDRVPDDEREGNAEPEERGRVGRVRPPAGRGERGRRGGGGGRPGERPAAAGGGRGALGDGGARRRRGRRGGGGLRGGAAGARRRGAGADHGDERARRLGEGWCEESARNGRRVRSEPRAQRATKGKWGIGLVVGVDETEGGDERLRFELAYVAATAATSGQLIMGTSKTGDKSTPPPDTSLRVSGPKACVYWYYFFLSSMPLKSQLPSSSPSPCGDEQPPN